MPPAALDATSLPGHPPPRRGKVRDVYDLGDRLLVVATDRISAFDVVLSPGIPGKGAVLTQLSTFWFRKFDGLVPNHLVETDAYAFPGGLVSHAGVLAGRSVLVKKCRVVPFECVARGYLAGSGWKEYQRSGTVCGVKLPTGLRHCDRLPEPIFTPATKAETGH
ncbi:MAG TPA: phosphoribosylaminoimidazolesuccinocarboxamide synthase, partial [Thermoanaerobaculia bacterium]|nr:phosphoribosylaminoimidazolesuccinocarboxamide synthase [Thermoanaerobaculia bacterium]